MLDPNKLERNARLILMVGMALIISVLGIFPPAKHAEARLYSIDPIDNTGGYRVCVFLGPIGYCTVINLPPPAAPQPGPMLPAHRPTG